MSNRCFGYIALGEYREALDLLVETGALAAERESPSIIARVGNTRGWPYEEFGGVEPSPPGAPGRRCRARG